MPWPTLTQKAGVSGTISGWCELYNVEESEQCAVMRTFTPADEDDDEEEDEFLDEYLADKTAK